MALVLLKLNRVKESRHLSLLPVLRRLTKASHRLFFLETMQNKSILSAELCKMAQQIVPKEHLLEGTTKQKESNKT